ncbi:MAG: hypothetical protein KDD99_13055 [Bacteroidetes bacterium]|nr:hypothetical protein [Bacteroidota bacterium]
MVKIISFRLVFMILMGLLFPLIASGQDHLKALATEIFTRLEFELGAYRNPNLQPPQIDFMNAQTRGAYYDDTLHTIKIEIPLCKLFQTKLKEKEKAEAAIAMVIGHELGHYVYQSGCSQQYGYIDYLAIDPNHLAIEDHEELKADFLGGFLGYMAGYETLNIYQPLFEVMYEHYPFVKENKSYPPLTRRIEVAEAVDRELEKMIQLFEAGQRLTLTGNYHQSIACYRTILSEFKGKEFYNNMAVACLLGAVDNSRPEEVNYVFPFEMDTQTRLRFEIRKTPRFNENRRKYFLKIARESLESAIAIDPYYLSAHLNLASVYLLEGKISQANDKLENQTPFAPFDPQESHYFETKQLIKGIGLAMQSKKEKALQAFDDLIRMSSQADFVKMAELNCRAVKGEKIMQDTSSVEKYKAEQVDGVTLLNPGKIQWDKIISLVNQKNLSVKRYPHSTLFCYENQIYIQQIDPSVETSQGYGVGDDMNDILARGIYGNSFELTQTRQGAVYVFRESGIMFWTDGNKEVTGWDLFQVSM